LVTAGAAFLALSPIALDVHLSPEAQIHRFEATSYNHVTWLS
jgi:hypothetical protein